MSVDKLLDKQVMGLQYFCGQKTAGRPAELTDFHKLVLHARTDQAAPVRVRVALITTTGAAWVATVDVKSSWQPVEIPLSSLQPSAALLLPRPYPGFLPLWFQVAQPGSFELRQVEKIEISLGADYPPAALSQAYSLEIKSLWLAER